MAAKYGRTARAPKAPSMSKAGKDLLKRKTGPKRGTSFTRPSAKKVAAAPKRRGKK